MARPLRIEYEGACYHLLLETPQGNLSKVMHYLNGSYTTYINVKG